MDIILSGPRTARKYRAHGGKAARGRDDGVLSDHRPSGRGEGRTPRRRGRLDRGDPNWPRDRAGNREPQSPQSDDWGPPPRPSSPGSPSVELPGEEVGELPSEFRR